MLKIIDPSNRLDNLLVDRRHKVIKSSLNGIGLNKTQFIGTRHTCLNAEQLEDRTVYIGQAFVDVESEKKNVRISFGDDFRLVWTPNIHILIHESMIEIIANVQAISPPATPTPSSPGPRDSKSVTSLAPVSITADAPELDFCFKFNNNKQIQVRTHKMRYTWEKNQTEMCIDSIDFYFDQHTRSDDFSLISISKTIVRYTPNDTGFYNNNCFLKLDFCFQIFFK